MVLQTGDIKIADRGPKRSHTVVHSVTNMGIAAVREGLHLLHRGNLVVALTDACSSAVLQLIREAIPALSKQRPDPPGLCN